jgi:hypothetical protein
MTCEERLDFTRAIGERGLKALVTLPVSQSKTIRNNKPHKAGCEDTAFFFHDTPGIGGFWHEEHFCSTCRPEDLSTWLRHKHGPDYRRVLGVPADAQLPTFKHSDHFPLREPNWMRRLWMEYQEWSRETLLEAWREIQEWMFMLRKGTAVSWSNSLPTGFYHNLNLYGEMGGVMDLFGPESYSSHGPFNTFMLELARNGESRQIMARIVILPQAIVHYQLRCHQVQRPCHQVQQVIVQHPFRQVHPYRVTIRNPSVKALVRPAINQ